MTSCDKILFVLHHYVGGNNIQYFSARPEMREQRIKSLSECITSIWSTFGGRKFDTIYENNIVNFRSLTSKYSPDILVCVCKGQNVINELSISSDLYQVKEVRDIDPLYLGFCVHEEIVKQYSKYQYYCHIEDDLIISDPLFFDKLKWFNQQLGNNCLLLPNRFEIEGGRKCFIDGYAGIKCFDHKEFSVPFLDKTVDFHRPDNVYAGSYFLNQFQLDSVIKNGNYMSFDGSWIGPLESSVSLCLQKSLEIYKPTIDSGFLEIQHFGNRYVSLIN